MDQRALIRRIGVVWLAVVTATACNRDVQTMTPDRIQQQYGISGAYTDTIATSDGSLRGTVVPVTLADGRTAQLVIPAQVSDPHAAYIRDDAGLHPVELSERASREEITDRPAVVQHRVEADHPRKRSWEKDALIIGASTGGGTAIGAVAGGKKGAAVGAVAGGIGGLIYDLAKRK